MPDPLTTLRQALAATYRVERELGQGGMATVFLAHDLKHGRKVAIKVLRPELASSIGPDRFLREIEIAARLQHPNILPVYDSGQADGVLYYIMPFVEGESLRDRLVREGPLAPEEAVRIGGEVADALDYAHRMGIVHRDIKPANILLSQGHAVVADFGVARAVSSSAEGGLTQAGMAVGSPHYMSPEQALGGDAIDGRTDIYALGIVLHEMLEGKPPYDGTTPQAIVAKALSGRPTRLARDALRLQPVIDRALAREPEGRFGTASDMKAALTAIGTGNVPLFQSPRMRLRLGIAALGLVALVAAILLFRPRGGAGDPRQSLIIFPFENRTGDESQDYLEEAAMNLLGLAASHWADLRVYDDERTASQLRRRGAQGGELDFAVAQEIARDARVGTLVLGDVRREGDSLAIEAKVHDVRSGERLDVHIVRAAVGADPRAVFDRLAAMILGASGAPPGERPSVLAQTTSSLEAYRAYLAGTSALLRFQIDSARTYLDRAIALDSTFALAYLRRRDAEGWAAGSGLPGGSAEVRSRLVLAAERHSASLPPRLRSLVDYHRAYEDGNYPRAREIASGMIARDSTDVEAWYQLGEAHYHHRANAFPRTPGDGNLGLALRAFQRTLALDSTYILAYQHIIDALGNCAVSNTAVCTADSAVYAAPDSLVARFGADSLAALRQRARDEQVATARGWVSAAPNTPRVRSTLVQVLFNQQRFDEAVPELDALERVGASAQAGAWRAMAEFQRGRYREAAAALDRTLPGASDTLAVISGQNSNVPIALFAAFGRLAEATALIDLFQRVIRVDSVPGPAGLMMAKQELAGLLRGLVASEAGLPDVGQSAERVFRLLDQRAGSDTARRRQYYTTFGTSALSTYLVTADTTLLARWLLVADTTRSLTWRVADGVMAFARGDTARARMRVDRSYRQPAQAEFSGEQGVVRGFAWGKLLAGLGESALALQAFARLDSLEARMQHPGLVLRSLLERGALYQKAGNTEQALAHYQRWLDAMEGADPALEREINRVRRNVALLRGDPG